MRIRQIKGIDSLRKAYAMLNSDGPMEKMSEDIARHLTDFLDKNGRKEVRTDA